LAIIIKAKILVYTNYIINSHSSECTLYTDTFEMPSPTATVLAAFWNVMSSTMSALVVRVFE